MKNWHILFFSIVFGIIVFSAGCSRTNSRTAEAITAEAANIPQNATIGSLSEIVEVDSIPVEGFSIVGGLDGTGSSQCPPAVREYLRKFILGQVPGINADDFIASNNTAIVRISGQMPTSGSAVFDIKVEALPGTDTSSLKNGILYGSELRIKGGFFNSLDVLAEAEGPIFINPLPDSQRSLTSAYIIGGGNRKARFDKSLVLNRPDFKIAHLMSTILQSRYGKETADAVNPSKIMLSTPPQYVRQPERFIEIIRAIYLLETPELTAERIDRHIQNLAASSNGQGHTSEIALEALGKASIKQLSSLLSSPKEIVRLRAGRCLLNLSQDQGLETLRQIASDRNSPHRVAALDAIALSAPRHKATAIARRLLSDNDLTILLAAYNHLRELKDVTVTTISVNRNLDIDHVPGIGDKTVYASRKQRQTLVFFGSPITVNPNILVSSDDNKIMISADAEGGFVWLMRTHPTQRHEIIRFKSSFDLGDIIKTLCMRPPTAQRPNVGGLGVSYDDMIAIVKKMCDNNQIDAQFLAGPLPIFPQN